MFTVHSGSGAQDFSIDEPALDESKWQTFRRGALKLMRTRGQDVAADLLESIPFELKMGSNFFGDDFAVLFADLPIDQYAELVDRYAEPVERAPFRVIANVISEICPFYIRFIAFDAVLGEGPDPVEQPKLSVTNHTVEAALADARQLIVSRGSTSGVDRAHTAFHGYLRQLCAEASIDVPSDADVTKLFRALRDHHPAFQNNGARSEDVEKVLRGLSAIISLLNPLRNRASLAHPNLELLDNPEAELILNCINTLLHYLNRKLS